MASKTDIVNIALGRLGAKRIMDVSDDTNKTARLANTFWDHTVREVLRSHPWNCAKTRVELGQLSTAPAFEWDYQYQLPSDFLRMVRLNGLLAWEPEDFYEIEGNVLLTDQDAAKVQYIKHEEDTTKYDSLLVKAIACKLAAEMCVSLSEHEGLSASLMQEFETVIMPRARRVDGNEKGHRQYDYSNSSLWVQSRRQSTNG
jgi:hypothetical protein